MSKAASQRFAFTATPLSGVFVVHRQPLGDARGSLSRLFCGTELARIGWHKPVAQINHTHTMRRATVRGLH